MEQRDLGASGLRVSAVGLGTWAHGGWAWGGAEDDESVAAIHAALDAGVTAIDTAPVYGFGRSEELLGRALRDRPGEAVVMTKAGLRWDDDRGPFFFESEDPRAGRVRVHRNARPDSLATEVDRSLARLGVERIDLLQLHWPDPSTPLAETCGALAELVRAGKVRAVGVSNFDVAMLEEARVALGDVPLASHQPRYSLLRRGIEADVLPWTRDHGVATLAYSPLEQGLLTGRVRGDRAFAAGDQRNRHAHFAAEARAAVNRGLDEVVAPIAARHGATVAQVVLAWTAAQPGVTCVLAGARRPDQARENAAAGDLALDEGELAAVNGAFAGLDLSFDRAPRAGGLRGVLRSLRARLRGR